MAITDADVRHIARLARLELSDQEVERLRGELSKILAYVGELESLEAGRAAAPEPPDRPLREDRVTPWPDTDLLHRAAPDYAGGFFRVPRVVE